MTRRVARETARLLGVASNSDSAQPLCRLAFDCALLDDDGATAEAFARSGGLVAVGVAVRAAIERPGGDRAVAVGARRFTRDVDALLVAASALLRRCHKQVLKEATESPLVDALAIACAESSRPTVAAVTAVADIVGSLAAACDYNALRGVELGLLDSVLRAAKLLGTSQREISAANGRTGGTGRSAAGRRSSAKAAALPSHGPEMAALNRAVLRALTSSGLDVPRQPKTGRRGVRILCLDGGGTRALASLEMVREIERLAKRPIYQLFDLIGGTSSGGVLALALGLRMRSVDECERVYKAMASRVFSKGTRVFSAGRLILLNKGQYNTAALQQVLAEALGDTVLVDTRLEDPSAPRVFVVSTLMSAPTAVTYLHANYRPPPRPPGSGEHRYRHGCHHRLWEAARASTAVPSYFDAFRSGGEIFCDGAILVNNPAAIAVHEARLLWPNAPLTCLVSVGTGRPEVKRPGGSENLYDVAKALIGSATDTEAVHHTLEDLAPEGVYFRFNPVTPYETGESLHGAPSMILRRSQSRRACGLRPATKPGVWARLTAHPISERRVNPADPPIFVTAPGRG